MELKDYLNKIWHRLRLSLLVPFLFFSFKSNKKYNSLDITGLQGQFMEIIKNLTTEQILCIFLCLFIVTIVMQNSCKCYSFNEDGNTILLGKVFLHQKGGNAKLYGWSVNFSTSMLSHSVTNHYMLRFSEHFLNKWERENMQIVVNKESQHLVIEQGMKFYVEKKDQNPYNRYN